MFHFLAFFFLAQLGRAENSTESLEAFPKIGKFDVNETLNEYNEIKQSLYQWKRVLYPTPSWPSDVVIGGMDSDYCKEVFVGRARYMGNILPAKVCSTNGVAYVSYGNSEVKLYDSEVLCTKYAIWKPITEAMIPSSAFPVGFTEQGERLYAGRWFVGVTLVPGKVGADSKNLQISYDNRVYNSYKYEILILKYDNDL